MQRQVAVPLPLDANVPLSQKIVSRSWMTARGRTVLTALTGIWRKVMILANVLALIEVEAIKIGCVAYL